MTTKSLSETRTHAGSAAGQARRTADRLIGRRIRAGVESYDRQRHLPALLRADPLAPVGETEEALEAILSRLERALRAERNRARSGHWTYDLNRHIALRQAHAAEAERLARLKAARH